MNSFVVRYVGPAISASITNAAWTETKEKIPFNAEEVSNIREDILILVLESVNIAFADTSEAAINELFNKPETNFLFSKHSIANVGEQPLVEYTLGACRDDFQFGSIAFIRIACLKLALEKYPNLVRKDIAAWYGARLALSLDNAFTRNHTSLYTTEPKKNADNENEHFAYVDPKNADAQKKFEEVFTEYAKLAGFYLPQRKATVDPESEKFEFEASVIIPVKNRKDTILDSINSVFSQKTTFKFNCIVVDNHSNDGTTEILKSFNDPKLVHHIPEAMNLGIGGCWDVAIRLPVCGKYIVQLDSDDLYMDDSVLEKIVTKLQTEKLAGLAGSYTLVDFSLKELPPGIIDHREWTDENGHNNGIRINGFGAPRAFYAPIARKIGFKNVSYGEDYAMMLAICRDYKLGRIYEPLYLCRRWDGNSDALPTIEKVNAFAVLKDGFRTEEILARKELVKKSSH